MRIGELAKATGVSTRSLRYYEEQGLLPAERLANGYREYNEQAVRQVTFIQDLYQAGLPSEIIRDIIPHTGPKPPQGECTALLDRVRQVRDQLAYQERQLAERREMLERYLSGAAAPANLATAHAFHSSCSPAPDHEARLP
ncbi:putative transcriptional regulator [Saccharomonospora marina XMU15]|uniref:Putative transcriptional regulator n=1 Tax=Saccharomonospora marina XMU15 TaxID=882083 RepID=H5WXI9_9PSEU|nr:MerR family transcriptional regulator [Saccharomonospora marina]EHR50592.1 putative transcriptional regulator [Saccharomonospora marina XMU15]